MSAPPTTSAPSPRRVVLVTGASAGIGLASARALAKRGWVVYGAARRVEAMEPLRESGVTPLPLDVTDGNQIEATIARILAEQGRIDAVVNNAGVGVLGAVEVVDLDEARREFEVNLFAVAAIVQRVAPLMRAQGGGRIVNMSSIGSHYTMPLIGWYHASKFAVRALTGSMRAELAPDGIHVSAIEPGPTLTEWSSIARTDLVRRSAGTPYEEWAGTLARTLAVGDHPWFSAAPDDVADYVVKALEARSPRARYVVGLQARLVPRLHGLVHPRVLDTIVDRVGKRLIDVTDPAVERRSAGPPEPLGGTGAVDGSPVRQVS